MPSARRGARLHNLYPYERVATPAAAVKQPAYSSSLKCPLLFVSHKDLILFLPGDSAAVHLLQKRAAVRSLSVLVERQLEPPARRAGGDKHSDATTTTINIITIAGSPPAGSGAGGRVSKNGRRSTLFRYELDPVQEAFEITRLPQT